MALVASTRARAHLLGELRDLLVGLAKLDANLGGELLALAARTHDLLAHLHVHLVLLHNANRAFVCVHNTYIS